MPSRQPEEGQWESLKSLERERDIYRAEDLLGDDSQLATGNATHRSEEGLSLSSKGTDTLKGRRP